MEKYGDYHLNQGIKCNIVCLWCAQRTRHHVVFLPKTFNLIYSLRNQPQKSELRHSAELQAYTFEGDWTDIATDK